MGEVFLRGVAGRASCSVKCETNLRTDCWLSLLIDQIIPRLDSISSANRWLSPSIFSSPSLTVLLGRENCEAAALNLTCVTTNEIHGTCFSAWFLLFCFVSQCILWIECKHTTDNKSMNVCREVYGNRIILHCGQSSDPTDQWRHMSEGNDQSQLMLTHDVR